jgi:hypothetical protein
MICPAFRKGDYFSSPSINSQELPGARIPQAQGIARKGFHRKDAAEVGGVAMRLKGRDLTRDVFGLGRNYP